MKRTVSLVALVVVLLSFGATASAFDVEGRMHLQLGAGSGYLVGDVSSATAPASSMNSRWPTYLDMSLEWGVFSNLTTGVRLAGTLEDSVAVSITPRVSWHFDVEPMLFSLSGGPAFYADPFLFGIEIGASMAVMFNEYIGLELNLTPQVLFVGDGLTGNGYLMPLTASFGLRGAI